METREIGRAFLVESTSDPLTHYVVIVGSEWRSCTCPDFTNRRAYQGTDCKHISNVRQHLLEGNE